MKNYIRYENRSKEALLQAVEMTPTSQGDSFVFFHSHKYANRRALRELVEKNLPEAEILSKTTVNGENIIIARTDDTPQHLISDLQEQTGETYAPARTEKVTEKVDLIRLRGIIGIVAQFLMIGSAYRDGDKKEAGERGETANGKAKFKTSAYGLLGNGINAIWGVQKEMDSTRLDYGKELINRGLAVRHGENEKLLPKPKDTQRTTKAKDEPSFMDRNSIRVGSAVKLWSKYELTRGDSKDLKLSGWLSIVGKIVSLTGLPEDRFQLEKKQDPITQMRRHSNFVSTFFDWTSTFSLFAGSFFRDSYKDENGKVLDKSITADKKKIDAIKDGQPWYSLFDFKNSERRSKDNIQWWQLSGAVAFALTLFAKAIAPYTNRKLDVDNLYNHATLAVASGVADNHVEELTQLTAQMLQTREFPEVHEQGFAKAFTDIANRLEKHHDIALHSPVDAAKTQLAEPTPEVEKAVELETAIAAEAPQPEASQPKAKTSFAAREKAEKKAIAPKTSMTEHVTAQPEALTASLST